MEYIKEKNKIYVQNEQGEIVAKVEFEETSKGKFNIFNTFVASKLRGKGIASELVKEAINEIHKRGGKVFATCSYAKKWLENNKIMRGE